MSIDISTIAEGAPVKVVANLPYNVGTPLLIRWLEDDKWPPVWTSLTLMFQREVAERIVATPTERADYGRLAVLAGWRTQSRILTSVEPECVLYTEWDKTQSSSPRALYAIVAVLALGLGLWFTRKTRTPTS